MDQLESDERIPPKLFDDDSRVIPLPPLVDGGLPTFVLIKNKGVVLTLDDGSIFTPGGIIAVNQTNRVAYVNAYDKSNGYTYISIIRKDDE